MPKLTLDLDALRVDSFDTSPAGVRRAGTVRAHADTDPQAEAEEIEKTPMSVPCYVSRDPDKFTCGDTCTDRCYTLPATCMTCTLDVCCPRQTTDADGF